MTKTILSFFVLLLGLTATAQELSGNYTSGFTTYKDDQNPKNNFQETTKFNVSVTFENENEGRVAIQDPRIPDKVLIYKVEKFLKKINQKGKPYYYYQAVTQHTKTSTPQKLVFYRNKKDELNLIVSGSGSSQVFHHLKMNNYSKNSKQ